MHDETLLTTAPTSTGTVLDGRYRLDSLIARGGMGQVWRATDLRLGRVVAVKMVREDAEDRADLARRFHEEARNAASLSHPGIATVHDDGDHVEGETSVPYLVMEFVDGEPLSVLLRRHGRLGVRMSLEVALQVAEAVGAAHRAGVVHRDLTAANVMVSGSVGDVRDGTARVKVTDFGLASTLDSARLDVSSATRGTPAYMSPEQALGRPVGPASDVFSLGVLLHELLSGRRPFQGEDTRAVLTSIVHDTPPDLPESVPLPLRRLVTAALSKDPSARPADGTAFAAALVAVQRSIDDATTTALLPLDPDVTVRIDDVTVASTVPLDTVGDGSSGGGLAATVLAETTSERRRARLVALGCLALVVAAVFAAIGFTGSPDEPTRSQRPPTATDAPRASATTPTSPPSTTTAALAAPPPAPASRDAADKAADKADKAAEKAADKADKAAERAADKADRAQDKRGPVGRG